MLSNNGRRSKIRAPKKNLSNDVDFAQSWAVLANAITEIENKNASNLSFEELYRKSYNLVLRKQGKQLYESVKALIGEHLTKLEGQIRFKIDNNNSDVVSEVANKWQDHLLSMRMISDVLMYLDRVYAKENHLPLVYDVGINLFRDNIIRAHNFSIGLKLNQLIMDDITANRNGLIIDIFLLKSIIMMFESLIEDEKNLEMGENYYLNKFEPFYLNKTLEYYEKLSSEIFEQSNGTIYLKKVNELIENEQNKCVLYIPEQTYPKLIDIVNKVLISSKIDRVLRFQNDGLKSWIQQKKYDDLTLLYNLLMRVEYFDGLKEQLREIILEDGFNSENEGQPENGKNLKKPTVQAIIWIEKMIQLKEKYDLVLKSFKDDVTLQKTIDNAFIELLNKNARLPEFLSLFIDDSVKKASDKSDQDIEKILLTSITIFRFIKDKDLFERYYKNHLAKRLLKSSKNFEIERSIISKFKNEVGSNFTSKLEGMFRDIHLSKETSQRFNHNDFEVNVLTKTYWPIQPPTNSQEVILPSKLFSLQRDFNDFYLNIHNGRYLTWALNFGSIDIRIKFDRKIHELNMSLYCGIIVLLFEEFDELTYDQIVTLTKIPESDLVRSLQSISVAPKTRILVKVPMTKDVKSGDIFKFNSKFTAPMTKVKVLTVLGNSKVETDSERSKTIEKLDEDRKFELDAAIVRIMKSRKILNHNELLVEIFKQINRFRPTPQFIKKRIDALLDREYLKRDNEDRTIYHYLA